MSNFPQTCDEYLDFVELVGGSKYSAEQRVITSNSDKDMIVFADPGTGKTHTVMAMLLYLTQMLRVPSSKIRALSFTREATAELGIRYTSICKNLRIRPNIEFSTIHSLCLEILSTFPQGFGMGSINVERKDSFSDMATVIKALASDLNLDLTPSQISKATTAIKSLNNSFKFNVRSVMESSQFKNTKMEYADFYELRKRNYRYYRRSGSIPRKDLCLYALDLLMNNPDAVDKLKEKIDVLIVDEGQDLSIIQLKMMSLIAKRLILVGDMKQQINRFAGACPEIVDWFFKFYPNAITCKLTQSFRNSNKIVDYAKPIILPNQIGGEDFKGKDKESSIIIKEGHDVTVLLDEVKRYYDKYKSMPYQLMFLYRNNNQEALLADEIFKRGIPAYIPKHMNALEIPIVSDLTQLVDLALNPRDVGKLDILRKVFPCFKHYGNVTELPIYKLMLKLGFDFFSVNYAYDNNANIHKLIQSMQELHDRDQSDTFTAGEAFNSIYKYYYELYLKDNVYLLEFEPSYYLDLVRDMVVNKSFRTFKHDEVSKASWLEDQLPKFTEGIKCFTMHTSKGKESDSVVIIEANDNLLPQSKKLDRLLKLDCWEEAADLVREERSLLFVAVTRARTDLTIMYRDQITSLLTSEGEEIYRELDEYYRKKKEPRDELSAFLSMVDEVVDSLGKR